MKNTKTIKNQIEEVKEQIRQLYIKRELMQYEVNDLEDQINAIPSKNISLPLTVKMNKIIMAQEAHMDEILDLYKLVKELHKELAVAECEEAEAKLQAEIKEIDEQISIAKTHKMNSTSSSARLSYQFKIEELVKTRRALIAQSK